MWRCLINIQAFIINVLLFVIGSLFSGGALWLWRLGKAEIVTRKIQVWEGMRYGGSGGARDYERFICDALPMPVDYAGGITDPKRVFIGASRSISFILEQMVRPYHEWDKSLLVEDMPEGKRVRLRIPIQPGKANVLVVELQAAGAVVDGEKRQEQQLLEERKLQYHWTCHFPNSGDLILSFRLIAKGPSIEKDFGIIPHSVKVDKLDHLTQRQLWILAPFLGIPGFIVALWGAIAAVMQFIHLAGLY